MVDWLRPHVRAWLVRYLNDDGIADLLAAFLIAFVLILLLTGRRVIVQ